MYFRKVLWSLAIAAVCLVPFAGSIGCTPPSDASHNGPHTTSSGSNTTNVGSNTTNN